MKKLILSCVMLVILVAPGVKSYSQTSPKLNTAFYYSFGIVADSKGNLYVTGKNAKIIKITPGGKAELFAGGGRNNKDGKGKEAGFSATTGIAIDSSDNLYVADDTRIRKITPDGTVTTVIGQMKADSKDGDKAVACFMDVENIAIDNKGNIYVTDEDLSKNPTPGRGSTGDYIIRKITPEGMVTTLKNGTGLLQMRYPRGLVCDKAGNLYICAAASHCIKKVTPDGTITTVAGQCDKTVFHSVYKEGDTKTAVLTSPTGIAITQNGDIYLSDDRLNRIIKISNNKVSTVAGSGKIDFTGNIAGASEQGEKDGPGKQAMFYAPKGIALDRGGNLYIVDGSSRTNSYIRKLSPSGIVTTFCKHAYNPKTQQYEEVE